MSRKHNYLRVKEKRLKKRYDNLVKKDAFNFEEMFSVENIYEASKICQQSVKWKRKVQSFIQHRLQNSIILSDKILSGKHKKKECLKFMLYSPGKRRLVSGCASFEDRIVMHLLCKRFLLPLLEPSFSYDNYACRLNKGTDFARARFKHFLASAYDQWGENAAVVQFDFKSYFPSIKSEIIFKEIFDYTFSLPLTKKDLDGVNKIQLLMRQYICEEDSLGIGNQTNQIAALFKMSKLDHFIANNLGYGLSGRYMDDGFIFCPTVKEGYIVLEKIKEFVESYGMFLNDKKCHVRKICQSLMFLKTKFYINDNQVFSQIARQTVTNFIKHYHRIEDLKVCASAKDEILFDSRQSFKGTCLRSSAKENLWVSILEIL